ncbi:cbb3-type cytochrome c oxidase N-terminal domain-containing protein [Crateriforma conspicua]|uniref:cbb3-type cytochrome c oxidase N-terminal domain-containing protein n=1 Tax=Crateriforma conspicua TaxID=2527996 RepID=UPI001187CED7|nr:cbb3-type cytochrome c oxidase N-terminal domain-containing protein [Crateriforma conspicua]QDV65355.1 Cbb3-type cytochrome c oxidase subunit CcoP2 [Crateriforma conspicua]
MSSVTPETSDTGAIPDDPLTGHSYDGIQEFDNPLPGWWKWLFVGSMLFSPPYFFYFHSGVESRTRAASYDRDLAENLQLQFAEIGELKADRETVVKFLYKPNWLQVGKVVFETNCQSCHGADGGGLVGPNLTDDHYKNIREIEDIIGVLQNGAAAGAMPAWKNRLSTNELVLAASYVASMRGTEAANPKAPEGNVIAPWPDPPAESDAQ